MNSPEFSSTVLKWTTLYLKFVVKWAFFVSAVLLFHFSHPRYMTFVPERFRVLAAGALFVISGTLLLKAVDRGLI